MTMVLRLLRILPYLGTVRAIAFTPKIFDRAYYLACNPDVSSSRMHPLLHFLLFGAFEGRKPNPLFDSDYYLRRNSDVAIAGVNPLLHYLKFGIAESRIPHPVLNPNPFTAAGADDRRSQFLRALDDPEMILYSSWLRREARIAPPPLVSSPRFSLLVTLSNSHFESLDALLASVRSQTLSNWELCICNNACAGESEDYLDTLARTDARIRVTHEESRLPASLALNHAAELAHGDYLAVLDPGDRLAPDALHWLAASAPADLIYSDEDRLDASGRRRQPLFKPDWSPDLLLSCPYIGRIHAISRAAWEQSGGFRAEYDPDAEYDLALRITENSAAVRHVPRVLYSRGTETSSFAQPAAQRAVRDAIRRRGVLAEVENGPRPNTFRLHRAATGSTLVSVIVCSRSPELLERCLSSLAARTCYRNHEVIVIRHLDGHAGALQSVIDRHRALQVTYRGPFHFSRMNNLGVAKAKGTILLFLNDDTEFFESSWLDRLVAQVERPEVGIAGARLLYPGGTLQHGGVAIGVGDGCAHVGRNTVREVAAWPWLDLTRDVSAVTGACLAIRTSLFRELGGFSDRFPVNYNDIDLCLRAKEAGYRVIYEAGAALVHHECQSRRRGVVTEAERTVWSDCWGARIAAGDPFYSPNLTHRHEDLSLRDPAERN
jgi:GT2 family glycosyltransferase